MRASAEVGERALAVDRDGRVFGQLGDQFALELLLLELVECLKPIDLGARERQLLGDDLAHALFDRDEVFRRERLLDREVVVEAILDGGSDAELHQRIEVLDRLGHHVGCRVTQDAEGLWALVGDDLDRVAVADHSGRHPPAGRRSCRRWRLAARRGPIASATPRTVEPSATDFVEPSGRLTVMSGMAVLLSSATYDATYETAPRTVAGRCGSHLCPPLPYCCFVLQYGQTCQLSLSALPHSTHGLRSFFMQYGQIRKSFSTGLKHDGHVSKSRASRASARADLELALARVLCGLGRPDDEVDKPPDEREHRGARDPRTSPWLLGGWRRATSRR